MFIKFQVFGSCLHWLTLWCVFCPETLNFPPMCICDILMHYLLTNNVNNPEVRWQVRCWSETLNFCLMCICDILMHHLLMTIMITLKSDVWFVVDLNLWMFPQCAFATFWCIIYLWTITPTLKSYVKPLHHGHVPQPPTCSRSQPAELHTATQIHIPQCHGVMPA